MADEQRLAQTLRWRNGLVLMSVLAPVSCSALFERQARRLDALARHGALTDARIVRVDGRGNTFYRYEVDHTPYEWNVARRAAPRPVGSVIRVAYLPETPSFSRPIEVPAHAADEAARSRAFARRSAIGVGVFFIALAALAHRERERLRVGANPLDPAVHRARVREALAIMVALVVVVATGHSLAARTRGESTTPVALAALLSLAVIGVTTRSLTQDGPGAVQRRVARLQRWLIPLAFAIALLRLLALLLQA